MQLTVATVGVRMFGITRGLFRYLERLATHSVALKGMASLRTHIYARLATGNAQTAATLRRGDLLARVSADVDAVGDVVVRGIIPALVAAVLSMGSVVFVGLFHIPAALALAVCLLLAGVVAPWLAQKAARETELQSSQARTDMSVLSHELVSNSAELAVAGSLNTSFEALAGIEQRIYRATDRAARYDGLAQGIFTFALVASALSAAVLGIPSVVSGALAPVELAVIVLTPLAIFEVLQGLPAAAVQVHTSRTAASRIMRLLDESGGHSEHVTGEFAVELEDGLAPVTNLLRPDSGQPTHGEHSADREVGLEDEDSSKSKQTEVHLRAEALTTGWPGTTVLSGLELDLAPGTTVALVGPSGTGKTTTLMTLAGLLDPRAGQVTLNGTPLGDLDLHEVARDVVFLAEDAHIFETTVLENLRVARGTTTETEAEEALTAAGLGSWLAALPNGVNTMLGAGATTISGGERRRLLLARAFCSTARVLLVDEPAEHLDPATADTLIVEMIASNRSGTSGRTMVIATHRLSPMAHTDEVLILEHGVVRDRGTHHELIERDETYRTALAAEAQEPQGATS
jgi:ATP-binding cassette subfamily C protein CydC